MEPPQVLLLSPYVRAVETAQSFVQSAGIKSVFKLRVDERLREKEFGILDRLTPLGIQDKFPDLH